MNRCREINCAKPEGTRKGGRLSVRWLDSRDQGVQTGDRESIMADKARAESGCGIGGGQKEKEAEEEEKIKRNKIRKIRRKRKGSNCLCSNRWFF
jgi:hypothetical protein